MFTKTVFTKVMTIAENIINLIIVFTKEHLKMVKDVVMVQSQYTLYIITQDYFKMTVIQSEKWFMLKDILILESSDLINITKGL